MKKYKKFSGFTLLELLVTVSIISITSLLAINGILTQIPDFKLKEDIKTVEQTLKKARSSAIKQSCTINTDFSKTSANNGNDGGIIEIKDKDGAVLEAVALNYNILLNTNSSNIENNTVSFDYRGQPVDSTGSVDGFSNANNKITLSYYDGSSAKASESLYVLPMTGNITRD